MNTRYEIKLEDGKTLFFDISDNRFADLNKMSACRGVPDWVRLEHHQCPNCPFNTEETKFCPAAFELQDVISQCSNHISYEKVTFSRRCKDGVVSNQADMQTALFAIIAEKAISSACKVINTRHWTLEYYSIIMTTENIFYRSLSSYLVRQFLISNSDQKADFQLNNYVDFVDEVYNIFGSLLERLRNVSSRDANNNAIVRLVMIAKLLGKHRNTWLKELKDKAGI